MVDLSTKSQWCTIDQSMALVARIFADFRCLQLSIAAMAQGTIIIANKSRVG
jgi:hypothetical protein